MPPADKDTLRGSHGQSRIVKPDGNIVCEASIFGEELLSATLDIRQATGQWAKNSLRCDFLHKWWLEGIKKVRHIEP